MPLCWRWGSELQCSTEKMLREGKWGRYCSVPPLTVRCSPDWECIPAGQ